MNTEELLCLDQPWPLHDVLNKLIEASEILLDKNNYDGHGWEEILYAAQKGKQIVLSIEEYEQSLVTNY